MLLDWTNWSRSIPARRDPAPTPARNVIERRWCRDAITRDADGNQLVDVGSFEAVAGSIECLRRRGGVFDPSFFPAIQRLEVTMHTECIARFNGPSDDGDKPGVVNGSDHKGRSPYSVPAA